MFILIVLVTFFIPGGWHFAKLSELSAALDVYDVNENTQPWYFQRSTAHHYSNLLFVKCTQSQEAVLERGGGRGSV